jgi:hypothetical protein
LLLGDLLVGAVLAAGARAALAGMLPTASGTAIAAAATAIIRR